MPCYSPLKGWKDPETGGIKFKATGLEETFDVACGQCIGCRLDRSRMWSIRMVHEASLHEAGNGSIFCTLTYRDKRAATREQQERGHYIPEDWSLRKSDVQKFVKRLRKRRTDKIKYYMAGEYGNRCIHGLDLEEQGCERCNVGRPHYHMCIFNLAVNDMEPFGKNKKTGDIWYTSQELTDVWKHGFVQVGFLTAQSAGYVARYCMKKINGLEQDDHYSRIEPDGTITALTPEYSAMSNGLGKGWYEKYEKDVFPSDEVPVEGKGVIKKAPRYYENIYKEKDPQAFEEMKERRQEFRRENEDEYTSARLLSKYKVKKAALRHLPRKTL